MTPHSSACVTWQNISSAAAHAVDTGSMCTWLSGRPLSHPAGQKRRRGFDRDGGCGHSRLGEWMRGGMTRGLLQEAPICLMMSH